MPRFRIPRRALLVLLAALTCAPLAARAQGFLAAASKDGIDAWVAGDGGALWRSLDGGATWSAGALGGKPLRALAARSLVVLAAGDSGQVWRSTDAGGSWTLRTVPGLVAVRALALPAPGRAYLAGDGGRLMRSDDGGATWWPQVSGTAQRLNALAFSDLDHGWAAGAGGTLLRTVDGGATWAPVVLGTSAELLSVAASGASVWVGSAGGGCWRSTTAGAAFAFADLGLEHQPDVAALALPGENDVWIAGGGGFVRHSTDGGATWTWPVHDLHGPVGAIAFTPERGVVALRSARITARWSGGAALALPSGATVTRSWTRQVITSGLQVRGNTLAINPRARNTVWAVVANVMYRTRDEGETWQTVPSGLSWNRANAFVISAKDTSVFLVAAVSNTGTRTLQRSPNAGNSWFPVLTHSFGEYGIPLEAHPDKPDTLFFAGESDRLLRSVNGGASWSLYGATDFNSPCDLLVVPGDESKVIVADGTSGFGLAKLLQSADGGASFTVRDSVGGSEVPELSCSRLRPGTVWSTTWSASGASVSPDFGATWDPIADLNRAGQTVAATWGTDIARDDPNMVLVGCYSGGFSYLSLDGGGTFAPFALPGSNYAFLARDRGTVLALQSGGIYKLRVAYAYTPAAAAATVTLTAPNGGEVWDSGTVHDVTWTASNVALARLEWRRSPADPWVYVADVDGWRGTYAWRVPSGATATAEVRVRDAWDANPADASDAPFTIVSTTGADGSAAPRTFALAPVAPTPLAAGARGRVQFDVPARAHVALELFDVQGQRVAAVADRTFEPGRHTLALETGTLRAGVYFVRMRAGAFAATRRVLVVR